MLMLQTQLHQTQIVELALINVAPVELLQPIVYLVMEKIEIHGIAIHSACKKIFNYS